MKNIHTLLVFVVKSITPLSGYFLFFELWNIFCESVHMYQAFHLMCDRCIYIFNFLNLYIARILTRELYNRHAAVVCSRVSYAFGWMKFPEFPMKLPWNLFLIVELTISQHWLSHCMAQCWPTFMSPYGVIRLRDVSLYHLAEFMFNDSWHHL